MEHYSTKLLSELIAGHSSCHRQDLMAIMDGTRAIVSYDFDAYHEYEISVKPIPKKYGSMTLDEFVAVHNRNLSNLPPGKTDADFE